MKSHTVRLTFELPHRMAFLNITDQVLQAVRDSGIQEGLCLVNAMHITASVFINDDEPGLHAVIRFQRKQFVGRTVPTLMPTDIITSTTDT